MATARQRLGDFGEEIVVARIACKYCDSKTPLIRLPKNFKCVDLKCSECAHFYQVKARTTAYVEKMPERILGAAWSAQLDFINSGSRASLIVVNATKDRRKVAIFWLAARYHTDAMYLPRKPLSSTARRAGWQGFIYDLSGHIAAIERLL
jgi:type II restriction enzyme